MTQARRPSATRTRLLTAVASAVCHLAILLAFVGAQPDPPVRADPPPILVQLVAPAPEPPAPPAPKPPAPEPPAPAPSAPKTAPTKPSPPRKAIARPAPASPDVQPLFAETGPDTNPEAEVSDAELASASTAASRGGGGGGACNMAQWLQGKLRKDRRVQAAMADAHRGRPIRVWNGDWVRHPGQDGNGLAAVREAIMWEVAFAPEACRAERVHGLVLLSLNDAPGAARVVVGSGDWRWTDLVSRTRR